MDADVTVNGNCHGGVVVRQSVLLLSVNLVQFACRVIRKASKIVFTGLLELSNRSNVESVV